MPAIPLAWGAGLVHSWTLPPGGAPQGSEDGIYWQMLLPTRTWPGLEVLPEEKAPAAEPLPSPPETAPAPGVISLGRVRGWAAPSGSHFCLDLSRGFCPSPGIPSCEMPVHLRGALKESFGLLLEN